MRELRTILIDDEPRGLSSLRTLLEYNCPEVRVLEICQDPHEALSVIEHHQPDLVFLDIAMPGKNAFELLRDFDSIPFEIIFVTAHGEYSVQALRLSAVDYLLKPVDDDLLIDAVRRASARVADKSSRSQIDTFVHNLNTSGGIQKLKLCIPSMKGFQVVEIAEIVYCEASSNYTYFHFTDRPDICASKPIHEYESLLEDCDFVRVHKSYLINMAHIQEYLKGEGGAVRVTGGKEVEVSRRKKDVLMQKMKAHFKF